MVHLCMFVLLALACTVLGAAEGNDGHYHYHYYGEVTNNVHHHGHGDDHHDDRIYRFQIGSDRVGAYSYLDDHGLMKGVYIDLLKSVCKHAGKRCHYMMDEHQRCWETKGDEEHPGTGLLHGAYDGCIGLMPTPERRNSFTFTKSFMKKTNMGFYFKVGHVPKFSTPVNLTSQVIGFVNGWALSPKCIRRQKKLFSGLDFTTKYYESQNALVDALQNDEVEAIVSGDRIDADALHLQRGGPQFSCGDGLAVMAHYGNKVVKWWNHAQDELVKEFGWKALCAKAAENHGDHGKIYCLEE